MKNNLWSQFLFICSFVNLNLFNVSHLSVIMWFGDTRTVFRVQHSWWSCEVMWRIVSLILLRNYVLTKLSPSIYGHLLLEDYENINLRMAVVRVMLWLLRCFDFNDVHWRSERWITCDHLRSLSALANGLEMRFVPRLSHTHTQIESIKPIMLLSFQALNNTNTSIGQWEAVSHLTFLTKVMSQITVHIIESENAFWLSITILVLHNDKDARKLRYF